MPDTSGGPVAMVLLRSPSGAPQDADLTVAGAGRAFPSAAAFAAVGAELAAAGFQVGPAVGISFSIHAPPDVFRRYFGVALRSADGVWSTDTDELPLDPLSADTRGLVRAIVLEPPVELMEST